MQFYLVEDFSKSFKPEFQEQAHFLAGKAIKFGLNLQQSAEKTMLKIRKNFEKSNFRENGKF